MTSYDNRNGTLTDQELHELLKAEEEIDRATADKEQLRSTIESPPNEQPMSDDKSKRGSQDRRRISLDDDYEVRFFAERHGISKERAVEIIKSVRGDRSAAERAAKHRNGGSYN